MTPTEINIACAKLDGWTEYIENGKVFWRNPETLTYYINGIFDLEYATSGDAIRALVAKQSLAVKRSIVERFGNLWELTPTRYIVFDETLIDSILLAPPEQIAKALLKSVNLWTE